MLKELNCAYKSFGIISQGNMMASTCVTSSFVGTSLTSRPHTVPTAGVAFVGLHLLEVRRVPAVVLSAQRPETGPQALVYIFGVNA